MSETKTKQPAVSVVIVNWNGKHLLGPCLDSLKKQTFKNFKTIVVDNGSSDGSIGFLKRKYSWVKVIGNRENLGFGRANNIGIARSSGEYVLLLNNDVVLDRHFLDEMVACANSCEDKIGGFSPLVLLYSNHAVIDSAGMVIMKNGIGIDRAYHKQVSDLPLLSDRVIGPCGMCPMFRRSALEKIRCIDGNYFCKDMFMYNEDIDMVMRLLWAGVESKFVGNAIAYHHRSASAKKSAGFRTIHSLVNYQRFLLRNFTGRMLLGNIFTIPPLLAYKLFLTLINYRDVPGIARLELQVMGELPKHRAFNKRLVRNSKFSDEQIMGLLVPHTMIFEAFARSFDR